MADLVLFVGCKHADGERCFRGDSGTLVGELGDGNALMVL